MVRNRCEAMLSRGLTGAFERMLGVGVRIPPVPQLYLQFKV